MLVTFALLNPDELRRAHGLLAGARWTDGRASAGAQAALAKNNEQLEPQGETARTLRQIVLQALDRTPRFLAAALPKRVFPPHFNRYGGQANAYGEHVDGAIRFLENGARVRTDLSCTVFLSPPEDYDGGELVIQAADGPRSIKLPAGHAVLYPGTSVHEVRPVTRGHRLAGFFWIESMVRSHEQRKLLLELDDALIQLRAAGETPATVALTGTYHNLLRMWADT
ncbi:MAG: Fe2+-dependent dioxygenase [Pseudomonadota bacterium]